MQKLYFSEGLIGQNWAKDICLTVASDGIITHVETGVIPHKVAIFGPVLPAMPNVHSHAFQRAFAGLAEYKQPGKSDFWSWRNAMYGFARQMTPEALEIVASALYVEMLKAGYSAVGEFHYLHNADEDQALAMSDSIIRAADISGIALTHLPVLYQTSDFGGKAPEEGQLPFVHTVDEFNRLLQILAPRLVGRHNLGVAFHSLRAVHGDRFGSVINTLEKINLSAPIHIHIAEQTAEVDACLEYTGKRPIEWLLENQPVDARWCLIHATHVVESEWQKLAETGAVVGLCPTTEANLGDGLFPLPEYIGAGGQWAIGSDSHISIDAREELRLLEYGQRLARQERTVLVPENGGHSGLYLWQMAALSGAQALGQPIGEIAVGKRADLIVLDDTSPIFAGATYGQVVDAFVFSGQPSPVDRVMVAGNWVVEGGKHRHEEEIFARYKKLVGDVSFAAEDR